MSPRFPPNTKIKDFGYPESHPLHYTTSIKHPRKARLSSDNDLSNDDDDDDDDDDEAALSDVTSTASSSTSDRRSRHHGNLSHEEYYNYKMETGDDDDDYDDNYEKDEINCEARAIFDFQPENDNEIGLLEGQVIWISYRHGQGWLVAEDPETGENGLVPEEYVELIGLLDRADDGEDEDVAKPFLPEILRNDESGRGEATKGSEDEWVDTDEESLHLNMDTIGDKTKRNEIENIHRSNDLDKSLDEMKI